MSRKTNRFYINHYLMKKNRKEVLESNDFKCAKCGQEAILVHHKDFSIDNHDINNLIPLCASCHTKLHKNRNKIAWDTKMIEVALMHRGLDKKDLASKLDMAQASISIIIRTGNTKNSTMRKIAEFLDYPIEAFISCENDIKKFEKAIKTKRQEKDRLVQVIDERVNELTDNNKRKNMYKIWITKQIREIYKVQSYHFINKEQREEIIPIIREWKPGADLNPNQKPT